ncbi:MAG: hypothetical protein AAB336_10455 [Acidobacteriota bacterium]
MKNLIYIGGVYCLIFAIFHLAFWKLFDWKNDLPKLNAVNRGVMQVLNLRLTYVFFVVAFLSFFFADDLINTKLGNVILGSISIFALMRAVEQLIFWEIEKIGIAFFFIFLLGAGIFAVPLFFT